MKAVVLIKKLLGLPASTKSVSGFLIALVGLITIGGKEAITHIGVLNRNEAFVCIGLGVVGFLSWLSGWLFAGKPVQQPQVQEVPAYEGFPAEAAAADDPLAFFSSPKCWGVILILSAAILSYFAASRHRPEIEVRARPPAIVVIAPTNAVPVTNEPPVVSFPPLELQGFIVNGAKSSAVINGQMLTIGEQLGDVVLVAVTPDYVTVGLGGQIKWLVLKK
jgi:hypothetical protein